MGARDFADPEQFVADLLREYLSVPPVMRCSDWADKYRKIAKGPEKGPWRTSRTPYLLEPMNCMDPENPSQKVVMMFATSARIAHLRSAGMTYQGACSVDVAAIAASYASWY